MRIAIVSDIPGRIRLRYGRDVFSPEAEPAVEAYFAGLPFVSAAKASSRTGSVLLHYGPPARDASGGGVAAKVRAGGGGGGVAPARAELLRAAGGLRFSALALAQPRERDSLRLIDEAFAQKLFSMLARQLFCAILLPSPVRRAVTAARFLRFARKGWACLKSGKIGVDVLDASAVGVSMAQGNFGTASSIMFLLGLSELLEGYTLKKTKSMLSGSLLINAETAWVEREGREAQIPVSQLKAGDLVVARTGATIPVDGRVERGEAVVNQAVMTGEPLGAFKKAGDSVYAGTVVEDGAIAVKAVALASGTRISRIVDMISESESLKASVQGRAERIADGIVPLSFLLAAGVFAATRNVSKALSVLLVDYSCAIKLATPISVISAMREASALRIVVKGGKYFESIAEAGAFIFDKTGTLTKARPSVSRVVPMPGYARESVLRLAACMEEHFPHSVATAIVRAAKNENLRHEEEHAEVEYVVAHGIATTLHGKKAIIGSHHFIFDDEGISATPEQQALIETLSGGESAIFLAVDGALAGFICVSDPLRDEAGEAISRLRELGVGEIVMLTGDSASAARLVSERLGLDGFRAQILPKDKADFIKSAKRGGRKVAMVGDGINDSPALAAADVSASMKDSSDIAREVADITLLDSSLMQLVTARLLGQRLMRRVQRNFNAIVGFNTALLALGIGNAVSPGVSALLHNLFTIAISAASTRPLLRGGAGSERAAVEARPMAGAGPAAKAGAAPKADPAAEADPVAKTDPAAKAGPAAKVWPVAKAGAAAEAGPAAKAWPAAKAGRCRPCP